jgi:hypothetical protein
MIFGNTAHGLIEHSMNSGRISAKQAEVEADKVLQAEYGTTLREECGSTQAMHEFTAEAYGAAREWQKHVKPKLPPMLAFETQLMAKVTELPSGRELWITGIPDYVAETELIDWKTAYRMWSKPKMQTTTQPMVYAWLLSRELGLHVNLFTYWIYSRQAGEWDTMSRSIEQPAINAAMALVIEVGRSIDAGIYPARPFGSSFSKPRGWWCSPRYCDAWSVCGAKRLITDEIVNDPAVFGWN